MVEEHKKLLNKTEREIVKTHEYIPKKEIYHVTPHTEKILEENTLVRKTFGVGSLTGNPKWIEISGMLEVTNLDIPFEEYERMVLDFKKLKRDYGRYIMPSYFFREEHQAETYKSYYLDIVESLEAKGIISHGHYECLVEMIQMLDAPLFYPIEENYISEWKYCKNVEPLDKYIIRVEAV